MASDHLSQTLSAVEESVRQLRGSMTSTLTELSSSSQTHSTHESETKLRILRDKMYLLLDERLMDSKARFKSRVGAIMREFNSDLDDCAQRARNLIEFRGQVERSTQEKVHVRQPAPISALLYNKHWRTLYNIFFAFMINIAVAEFVRELVQAESYIFGLDVLTSNFSKIFEAAMLWVCMFLFSFVSVGLVQLHRFGVPRWLLVILHMCSVGAGVYYSSYYSLAFALPIASSIMFMCESVRLLLKMHSYFREKLLRDPTLVSPMPPSVLFTEFKRFLYFSFAPTLIYRDSYPVLERRIRWSHALVHVVNFFATIFYTTILFKGFCLPEFASASHMHSLQGVLRAWLVSTLPGTMVFLNLFFGVSHSFFSIFAEMLQFADRGFYGDWWNARDFSTLFRKLSTVLSDWVDAYIFRDSQRLSRFVHPLFAQFLVFLFMGGLSELILSVSVGFPYPVLFILLAGPGTCLLTAYTKYAYVSNVLVWVVLIMMNGLLMLIYFLEYYATQEGGLDMYSQYGVVSYIIPQWVGRLHT